MTEKQHNILFTTILMVCVVLIFVLKAPYRNFIPIVWGGIGFALYSILMLMTWINLSKILINEHKDELLKMRIRFYDSRLNMSVDMVSLFKNKRKIIGISDEIKIKLSYFQTFLRLSIIAFIMFAVLGVLTVVITWK